MGIQYPEVLMDAAASLAQELEKRGLPPEMASDAAFAAVEALRSRWGGADVYIPKAEHIELGPRHAQIYERWKASEDYFQIKKDFDYSIQWLRQIIRTARLLRAQKVTAPQLLDCG